MKNLGTVIVISIDRHRQVSRVPAHAVRAVLAVRTAAR